MFAVYRCLQSMYDDLHRCTDCCKGDYTSFHCPLCPVTKYKPRSLGKVKKHLEVHWKTKVEGKNGLHAVICHLTHGEHPDIKKRHYHCPMCQKIITQKVNMEHHVNVCKGQIPSTSVQGKQERENRKQNNSINKKVPCDICGKSVHIRWLKAHKRVHRRSSDIINENRHHHTVVVSAKEGIFCSIKNLKGPSFPVHIIKRTSGENTESLCDNHSCNELKDTAKRGNNVTFECPHLLSTPYAVPGRTIKLKQESLSKMKDENFITDQRYQQLMSFKNTETSSPLIVDIPPSEASSERYIFLSVFTGTTHYWSKVGRTVVTFDKCNNVYTCRCSPSRRYCLHKAVAKWFIFQEHPHFFSSSVEIDNHDNDQYEGNFHSDHNDGDEDRMTKNAPQDQFTKLNTSSNLSYIQSKQIPPNLPQNAKHPKSTSSVTFSPLEMNCHQCHGKLLEETSTTKGKVVTMTRVVKDITTYWKICPQCRCSYMYQEWIDGYHNFNNKLILGLDVCLFLRAGIQVKSRGVENNENDSLPVPPACLSHKDLPDTKGMKRSSDHEKPYLLRPNPTKKRKRSSFIYTQPTKRRLVCSSTEGDNEFSSDMPIIGYEYNGRRFSEKEDPFPEEIVELYISLKTRECKDKKVYFLPCQVMTLIFGIPCDNENQSPVDRYLDGIDIESYDILIGARCEGGCHWTLMVIYPEKCQLVYLNPLGETEEMKELYKTKWLNFLTDRYNKKIGTYLGEDWSISSKNHEKQQDKNSSGIFVLKFADKMIKDDKNLFFDSSKKALEEHRMHIGQYLVYCKENIQLVHVAPSMEGPQSCQDQILASLQNVKRMVDYEQVCSEKEDALLESLSRKDINPKLFPNPLAEKEYAMSGQRQDFDSMNMYEDLKEHLYNIVDCEVMQCQQECHRRHHQFMARPLQVSNAERKNNNFGHDVLPKETINYLQVKFSLDFVHTPVDQSHPYKLKKGTIRNMKNEKLASIFRNFWLVDSYITGVLLKETVIYLHSKKSGKSYESSEEDCKKSEINLSEELKRIRSKKT